VKKEYRKSEKLATLSPEQLQELLAQGGVPEVVEISGSLTGAGKQASVSNLSSNHYTT
jgi:hypothetical protein